MEYHRKEQKENVIRLNELFLSNKKTSKLVDSNISYHAFHQLMKCDFDQNLTEQDTTTFYRSAYVAGGANASFEGILLALTERYILLYIVILVRFGFVI